MSGNSHHYSTSSRRRYERPHFFRQTIGWLAGDAARRYDTRADAPASNCSRIDSRPQQGSRRGMPTDIKFGTSGWREIVAEDFTFPNIRRAVTGIAAYVASQPGAKTVLVGRDPRFLGEMFVAEAARVLAAHGLTPVVIPEAAPTPAISYAVREQKAGGSINFTASHNPPEYNGIKFSTPDGAPALPDVTKQIEAAIRAIPDGADLKPQPGDTKFEEIDVKPDYLKRLG